MPCDFKIYDTIKTYMTRYKGYTDDIKRHIKIDALYIVDKRHFIIAIDHPDFTELRPDLSKTIIVMHKNQIAKYYPPPNSDIVMIKQDQSYFDPKSNQLKFIKGANPLWAKWHLVLRADRFFGAIRPDKLTRIDYCWYYDSELKTLNFIISSNTIHH